MDISSSSPPRLLWVFVLTFFVSCQSHRLESPKIDIDLEAIPEQQELFAPNFISTGLFERDMAITTDGTELIYSLGNYDQSQRCLVRTKNINGTWSNKEILTFSGQYDDLEPFISPGGDQLYFASNRPLPHDTTRTDYNIWVADRHDDDWTDPKPLSPEINATGDEFFPAVGSSGNIYFTATREEGIGREDIFVCRYLDGAYQTAEPLDTNINSPTYEFNAYVNPEENLILFSSYGRADGLGGGDLYISMKDKNGVWAPAKNLGPDVNSQKLDYSPFIDLPRGVLYFTSMKTEVSPVFSSVKEFEKKSNGPRNGLGDIYRAPFATLSEEFW